MQAGLVCNNKAVQIKLGVFRSVDLLLPFLIGRENHIHTNHNTYTYLIFYQLDYCIRFQRQKQQLHSKTNRRVTNFISMAYTRGESHSNINHKKQESCFLNSLKHGTSFLCTKSMVINT